MTVNQTTMVEQYLIQKGHISSWEAIKLFGATRLSAIIYALRNGGMNIKTERHQHKNRYGYTVSFAKYILVPKNGKRMGRNK